MQTSMNMCSQVKTSYEKSLFRIFRIRRCDHVTGRGKVQDGGAVLNQLVDDASAGTGCDFSVVFAVQHYVFGYVPLCWGTWGGSLPPDFFHWHCFLLLVSGGAFSPLAQITKSASPSWISRPLGLGIFFFISKCRFFRVFGARYF